MRLTGDINVMQSALYELQAKKGGRKLLSPNRHRRRLPQIRSELSSKHRAGDILENLPNLTEADSKSPKRTGRGQRGWGPLTCSSRPLFCHTGRRGPPVTVSMATVLKRKKRKKPEGSWEIPDSNSKPRCQSTASQKIVQPWEYHVPTRSQIRPRPPSGLIRGCATARHCGP